jgi:aminomethyltransferase
MTDENARTLPLDARHRELGARMVPFAGFAMPLQYSGIKDEHHAVRTGVGIFDVSHMGEVEFRGPDAIAAVDHLMTNDVSKLADGQALYSAMCNEEGGIVDDLVLYRLAEDHVLVCVNASNRQKDFEHMKGHLIDGDFDIEDRSDEYVQLAVQGPQAQDVLDPITAVELDDVKYYRGAFTEVGGRRCFLSRTGYTGEDGFELYIPSDDGVAVYDAVMDAGQQFDIQPCGLGARDTLRLEAKMLLYGNDIDESTNPIEAGLSWVVKMGKDADFVGKQAIARIKEQGVTRRMRGFILRDRGVLRPGYAVFAGKERIGELTSGSFSPTLDKSIGLGYVAADHANSETVEVEVRGRRLTAELTKKPFYKRDS